MAKTIIRLPGQFEGTDEYQPFLANTSDIFDDLNNQSLNDTLQNVDVDRVFDAATFSGMGKVALRKNIQTIGGIEKNVLTQAMLYITESGSSVPNINTVFVVKYDYDLNGQTISIPNNCVLKFEGGSFDNGTIVGNKTRISADLVKVFGANLTLTGSWDVSEGYAEWFGAVGDGVTNDTSAIQVAVNVFERVQLTDKYRISSVTVPEGHTMINSHTLVYNGNGWVLMSKSVLTGGVIEVCTNLNYKIGNGKVFARSGIGNYQEIDPYDYDFIKNDVSAAITLGENKTRRTIVSDIRIVPAGTMSLDNDDVGGDKATYICCAIKTLAEKTNYDKWNTFCMFTNLSIYSLFYGIVGNIRASQIDACLEQCYDNLDIQGGLNVINIKGQTCELPNLGTAGNPNYLFPYFMYVIGSGNVINDGVYDIGSDNGNHQYLIKETSANVLKSWRLKDYKITVANPLNGDFRAGTGYTWYGGHKHDFLLKGLKYRTTLANGIYSGNIEACNLFDATDIELTPTGNRDANGIYPNTMVLTVLIEGIKNPYGVTAFFLSDGFTFQHMKIYYGVHAGTDNYETDLKADIARGSVSYMDWNADCDTCKSSAVYPLRIVFESNEVVRMYGLRVYGKTNQNITSGDTASRPVKTPNANTAKADLVIGQQYYDTTLERPVFYNGNNWTDPIGEVIGRERIGYFHNVTVPLPQQNVTVVCNQDGTFAFSGPGASGGGGRYVKLSNVFTSVSRVLYTDQRDY